MSTTHFTGTDNAVATGPEETPGSNLAAGAASHQGVKRPDSEGGQTEDQGM